MRTNSDISPRSSLRRRKTRASRPSNGLDDAAYGDGVTRKLGPANLQRHPDGSASIDGKKVDNPDDYKGEPIVTAVDQMKEDDAKAKGEES